MKLGMGLVNYQRLEQKFGLNHSQRLGLKLLLSLSLKLKDPEFPGAAQGLEGMLVAHQLLQQQESAGLLIGGLSEAVWHKDRRRDDLYEHKDVDVIVLDEKFGVENYENGIDWWIPQTDMITLRSDRGDMTIEKTWYENANGVVLSFGVKKLRDLPPGLYIPDSEWVIDMRQTEAVASVDYKRVNVEIDNFVFEKFRNYKRKGIKKTLAPFVAEAFKGHVLSSRYERDEDKVSALELYDIDLETKAAIYDPEEREKAAVYE